MSPQQIVYIVDDDEPAAASVAALMTSIGLPVQTYATAEKFLAVCDQALAGCLILDVRLSGMDGLELQKELKARECPLPIIMISGHADGELSEKAIANGAVACLEKPFPGEELCGLVRSALSGKELS